MMDKNFLVKLTPQLDWILKSLICTRLSLHSMTINRRQNFYQRETSKNLEQFQKYYIKAADC